MPFALAKCRNLLLFALLATAAPVAHAASLSACTAASLGHYVDSHSPAIVLLGEPKANGVVQEVQMQIVNALPDSLPVSKFKSNLSLWVRDWLPVFVRDGDKPKALYFQPRTAWGKEAQRTVLKHLEHAGIPVTPVEASLDIGNFITNGERVFIAWDSKLATTNALTWWIDKAGFRKRVEEAFGLPVTFFTPMEGESTGHIDMFVNMISPRHFVVADSRDETRHRQLDEAAQKFTELGYKVTRVMNAGDDSSGEELALSYTNALIVENRVLLPVYSDYIQEKFPRLSGWDRVVWKLLDLIARDNMVERSDRAQAKLAQTLRDDQNAIETYVKLGYDVYPIKMNATADLHGAVHCLTRCLPREVYEIFPVDQWTDQIR